MSKWSRYFFKDWDCFKFVDCPTVTTCYSLHCLVLVTWGRVSRQRGQHGAGAGGRARVAARVPRPRHGRRPQQPWEVTWNRKLGLAETRVVVCGTYHWAGRVHLYQHSCLSQEDKSPFSPTLRILVEAGELKQDQYWPGHGLSFEFRPSTSPIRLCYKFSSWLTRLKL